MAAAYRELEQLVMRIQQELAPNAEVLHDQMLRGRKSKRDRQIDVLVKDRIGQYDIQIIIDCKDYKRPLDQGPALVPAHAATPVAADGEGGGGIRNWPFD